MWENAYLSIKNPKASRALKWALDPGRKLLASLVQLRFATSATFGLSTTGPPLDQILDPHLKEHTIHIEMRQRSKLMFDIQFAFSECEQGFRV